MTAAAGSTGSATVEPATLDAGVLPRAPPKASASLSLASNVQQRLERSRSSKVRCLDTGSRQITRGPE